MEKSKHLQDQLKELKSEIESLKLEEQQQQAGVYSLHNEARGYVQEPVYIPHSNVRSIVLLLKIPPRHILKHVKKYIKKFNYLVKDS